MGNQPGEYSENISSNEIIPLLRLREDLSDSLDFWAEAYFRVEVTTSQRSQAEQRKARHGQTPDRKDRERRRRAKAARTPERSLFDAICPDTGDELLDILNDR